MREAVARVAEQKRRRAGCTESCAPKREGRDRNEAHEERVVARRRQADETKLVVVALMAMGLLGMPLVQVAGAQAVSTTTVQGTVYLANGQPGSGTLDVSWPAFTTANGQAVAADSMTVTIAPDGFVSVNLAPNLGATPAGLYYTAVFYMSDGTTSTQYWVVPAAAQASLAQVQAQLMPAAQAVQAVSKAYVDQAIAELTAESADGVGRNAERAAVFERRSDAAVAGGGQALCGYGRLRRRFRWRAGT